MISHKKVFKRRDDLVTIACHHNDYQSLVEKAVVIMSSITGSCCESPSQLLFDKGIEAQIQKLVVEKHQLLEQEQLSNVSTSTETGSNLNSSQQNNQRTQEGFKGINIDYFA